MAMNEIPEIIMQSVSRDEAALAIAQKVSCKQNLEDFVLPRVFQLVVALAWGHYMISTSICLINCTLSVICLINWIIIWIQVFKRLYENTTSQAHVRVHLGILESIRDVCKRVVKELTSWVSENILPLVQYNTYTYDVHLRLFLSNLWIESMKFLKFLFKLLSMLCEV